MALQDQSMASLRMRQQLGREIIKMLRQARRDGEEGASEAKEHYEAQLMEITTEIKARLRAQREEQGIEKPPSSRIAMKTASLGAKALS